MLALRHNLSLVALFAALACNGNAAESARAASATGSISERTGVSGLTVARGWQSSLPRVSAVNR